LIKLVAPSRQRKLTIRIAASPLATLCRYQSTNNIKANQFIPILIGCKAIIEVGPADGRRRAEARNKEQEQCFGNLSLHENFPWHEIGMKFLILNFRPAPFFQSYMPLKIVRQRERAYSS
jgi:hypothetical protein